MGLLPPLVPDLSVFRGILLWSLYLQLLFSPLYNWPSDYLTRSTNCRFVRVSFLQYVWTCDNACDLFYVNQLPVFDYIVVGSGAAGSVIANRLATAHSNRKTLLIEAGSIPIVESVPPTLFAFNLNTTSTYNYYAQPSPNYGNAFKNGIGCYAGKTVGGTTSINAMIYACGCDEDYNAWATAANDVSWNYANFLQYIKKPQGLQDPSGSLSSGSCGTYQGTTGPVVLNNMESSSDFISPIVVAAAAQLGYPLKPNSNCGPPFTGFGNIPMSINAGQRQSAARSYIIPIAGFTNLYVMYNTTVSKVTTATNSAGRYATGVTVITSRSRCPTINLQASREVIISAGALNSPGILLRSGIGRSADLSSCGIPQVSDVPTGKTLTDHVNGLQYFTMPGVTSSAALTYTWTAGQAAEYLSSKTGYFSRITGLNVAGFINTVNSAANCPNVQYIATRYEQNLPDMDILFNNKWGFKPEFANQLLTAVQNNALIQTFTSVLKPKSTGTVTLGHCTNPFVPPIINANYFTDPSDLDTMVQGMLFICQLFSTPAAVNAGIQPFTFDIPECNSLTQCTDAYFRCYVKYVTMNEWHPSGTCKMGTSSANGVVNNRLKVFGVDKLRVADASIMPEITCGNVQCPVYAIGEKAADMIIADNP